MFRRGTWIEIAKGTPVWFLHPQRVRNEEHRHRQDKRERSLRVSWHRGQPAYEAAKTYNVRVAEVWTPVWREEGGAEDWWVGWRSGSAVKWTRAKYVREPPSDLELLAEVPLKNPPPWGETWVPRPGAKVLVPRGTEIWVYDHSLYWKATKARKTYTVTVMLSQRGGPGRKTYWGAGKSVMKSARTEDLRPAPSDLEKLAAIPYKED